MSDTNEQMTASEILINRKSAFYVSRTNEQLGRIFDQVSRAVLDTLLTSNLKRNVIFETAVKKIMTMAQCECTTAGLNNRETVVRQAVREVGFDSGVECLNLNDFFELNDVPEYGYLTQEHERELLNLNDLFELDDVSEYRYPTQENERELLNLNTSSRSSGLTIASRN